MLRSKTGRIAAVGLTMMGLVAAAVFARSKTQPLERDASVRLWLNTAITTPCEHAKPASGEWTVHNKEPRTVRVTMRRTLIRNGAMHQDLMQDTLEPGEYRELGCQISEDGRSSLLLIRAVY